MRRGETLILGWRDIDPGQGVIHTRSGTREHRSVPPALSEKPAAILERPPWRSDTDLVFHEREGRPCDVDRLNGVIEGEAGAAGTAGEHGVVWKRFRHTRATRLAASGNASQLEIAKWTGHTREPWNKANR